MPPKFRYPLVAALLLQALFACQAAAQCGSMWGNPETRRPLSMADASWTYQQILEPKQLIKVRDLVTVVVREKSRMTTEGQVDRRKKTEGAMALNDWIALDGFSIIAAPQRNGDPKVSGIVDNKYRSQANLQEKDMLEFNIACEVVDIRPNGTIVVEGHRKIQVNEEEWEFSLTGIVRPEDILPNNTVQSEKIADLRVHKRQAGHGRDGVRRGWLLKWLDTYQPF
jgi:flagellar L-ring protein precursor FlgH